MNDFIDPHDSLRAPTSAGMTSPPPTSDDHLILPASSHIGFTHRDITAHGMTSDDLLLPASDGLESISAFGATVYQAPTLPKIGRGTKVGRYEIVAPLGKGAMGEVFLAVCKGPRRQVAIKFIRGDEDERARSRMHQEADGLAGIQHPNIPRVYEVDHDSHGRLYIVMDYIAGDRGNRAETLQEWLHRCRDELELRDLLRVFLDIGGALQTVHERGLIHRDIKPANILIGRREKPWLVDFGLIRQAETKLLDTTAPQLAMGLTQIGSCPGTPNYMAPELLRKLIERKAVDANERSDQYAFCVSLFEAIFDLLPYPIPKPVQEAHKVYRSIMQHELQRPHEGPFAAEVTTKLWQLLQRGLAKDPADRHASMAVLNAELAAIIGAKKRRWRVSPFVSIALLTSVALGLAGFVIGHVNQTRRRTFESSCLTPANRAFDQGDPQQATQLLATPSCGKLLPRFGLAHAEPLARSVDALFNRPDDRVRDAETGESELVSVIELLVALGDLPSDERAAVLDAQHTVVLAELTRASTEAPERKLAPYLPLTVAALLRGGHHDAGFDSQLADTIAASTAASGEPPLFAVFARQLLQPDDEVAAQLLAEYADQATQVPDLRASLWALRAFRLARAALERPATHLDAARAALLLPESGHLPDPRCRLARTRLELAQQIVDHLDGRAPTPMQLELLARRADAWWWDHHYRYAVAHLH